MPKAKCPLCHYETDDLDPALSAAQLNLHALFHTHLFLDGETVTCIARVYISDSVNDFYLSYDTMLDLGILGRNFPSIGQFRQEQVVATMLNSSDETCDCPKRSTVPVRPEKLPFTPTEDNNEKMG